MKAKEIRDLIDFISNTGLEEVNIETEEFKIKVKRSSEAVVSMAAPVAAAPIPQAAPAAPQPNPAPATEAPQPAPSNLIELKSPMIGTFYRTPNPDSPSFVNIGDKVKPGDTVCIIEAMKLFNEIECEITGTIVEVLVDNATPVEYDQPLFLVDPS
ncbi:MAG: acetyl-CoA carboxylase biotin carboxyl carrier protein [Cyclobacteriaceae bacterium]|jgi:acetyl-CoA carboxylase biotin carboxyl carrier protein